MKTDWNTIDLIELVEAYAEGEKLCGSDCVSSEQELSDRFDSEHAEWLEQNKDDSVMITEEFNNWTDSLCKDGDIHQEQYNTYCYVGKYSD